MSVRGTASVKSPLPPPSETGSLHALSIHPDQDPHEELMKMRLGTSSHHTNPRSRTLIAWKNSMPIEEYRFVREQKRTQKNIPTTSSDYKEQHLIIAHRLAELEKRRVGTRYLPKSQAGNEQSKKAAMKEQMSNCVVS